LYLIITGLLIINILTIIALKLEYDAKKLGMNRLTHIYDMLWELRRDTTCDKTHYKLFELLHVLKKWELEGD
jgi:hypothetical protein